MNPLLIRLVLGGDGSFGKADRCYSCSLDVSNPHVNICLLIEQPVRNIKRKI